VGPTRREVSGGSSESAGGGGALADVYAVLMAGGFGRRLWPLGTDRRPKQFLTELSGRSLYVQAAERAARLVGWDRLLVVTNARLAGLVREQTPDLPPANLLEEPMRRNTAPAVILAALAVRRRVPDGVMVVMPSDHLIEDEEAFRDTLARAVARARRGGLGTVGVPPTRPATGFGYLELQRAPTGTEPVRVERFVEKPDRPTAERYVASGRYLWNAGIFIWRCDAILEAAAEHLPRTCRALVPLADVLQTPGFAEAARRAFEAVDAVSVDFGIMEKAEDVWTVPATFQWDDVGGWLAAERFLTPGSNGNRFRGRVIADEETRNALVVTPAGHPTVVAGLADVIVVHTPAGTLVCHKSAADRLKPLIERVLADGAGA